MKTLKNLFIKDDDTEQEEEATEKRGFPIGDSTSSNAQPLHANPHVEEIIEVYEKGLESINMPGYDFYDFYNAIKAAGAQTESVYKIAFQMGKTMDANISSNKLVSDAEFYISKINEVYQNYSEQGRQKLDGLNSQLSAEKNKLAQEASRIESEIKKMKEQIQAQERKLNETRNDLAKVEDKYKPQQGSIQQKLTANDQAMQISIQRLNSIKEGILKYLK